MNNNKIVFIALGVLIILIVLSLFLSNLVSKRSDQSLVPISPVPTQVVADRGQSANSTFSPVDTSGITTQQNEALDSFKKLLPVENEQLSIDYSPYLNQFFVKEATADADLDGYLAQNNLLELKNQNKELFVITGDSPKAAILKAEDKVLKVFDEDSETDASSSESKEEADQMQPLADLFDKMMNLKFESASTQTATGNAGQLLSNPRLILSQRARQDLQAGIVDQRLIDLLTTLTQKYTISVGVFKTGHRTCVGLPSYFGPPSGCPSGHRPSDHYFGRGADIGAVNNAGVNAGNQAARSAAQDIAALSGPIRPTSVGQPWGAIAPGFFTDGDHKDHIHIGYH